jgi:hypothetical protein
MRKSTLYNTTYNRGKTRRCHEPGLSVWGSRLRLASRFGTSKRRRGRKALLVLLAFTLRADSVANSFLSFFRRESKQAPPSALTLCSPSVARVLRFYTRSASEGYLLVRCISWTHFVVKCLYARRCLFLFTFLSYKCCVFLFCLVLFWNFCVL